ncbi:MAG: hypothetical protein R3A49_13150 [Acidimicrobiia bacterium]
MEIPPFPSASCDPDPSMRHRLLLRHVATLAIALLTVVTACGGGSDEGAGDTTSTAAPRPESDVEVIVNEVAVDSAGTATDMAPGVVEAIRSRLDAYVQQAMVAPLLGEEPTELAGLFTPFAATRLDGPDRESLIDAGIGPATADLMSNGAAANLTGLADKDGRIVVVAASLFVDIETQVEDGPVHITRSGEVVLVPEGFDWKIDSFDLAVQREVPGGEPTDAGGEPGGSTEEAS